MLPLLWGYSDSLMDAWMTIKRTWGSEFLIYDVLFNNDKTKRLAKLKNTARKFGQYVYVESCA